VVVVALEMLVLGIASLYLVMRSVKASLIIDSYKAHNEPISIEMEKEGIELTRRPR